jgi:uncharacterized phage protein (TIGR01671 family)
MAGIIVTTLQAECGGVGSGLVQVEIEVDPEAVGQFIGLRDKNGVEIYGGDVVESSENFDPSVVKFDSGSFYFWDLAVTDATDFEWEVIGNIHDNPELKEAGE